MTRAANKHRRVVQFNEGDSIFLKLRPHRQSSIKRLIFLKLVACYYGPFIIEKKIGNVAYKLRLPPTAKVHPVFHVSLLKRVVGDHPVITDLLKELEVEDDLLEPKDVLQQKLVEADGCQNVYLLIKWKGKPVEEATWMPYFDVINQFPSFSLEDKAVLKGEDNDRSSSNRVKMLLGHSTLPQPLRLYFRKKWKQQNISRSGQVEGNQRGNDSLRENQGDTTARDT